MQEVIDKFIEPYKKDKNVIGIVLVGSYAYGEPQKNSDIDIYIVLNNANYRTRGNTWKNGYEIEYFINPVKQVLKYLEDEIDTKSTAKMLSCGKVLYEKNSELRNIIAKAKKAYNKKVPKLQKREVNDFKYFLDDLYKDFEDVREDKATSKLLTQQIIELCIKVFFRVNRETMPKKKVILTTAKKLDSSFYRKLKLALEEEKIAGLVKYTEKLLGGKRPRECIAKADLTC